MAWTQDDLDKLDDAIKSGSGLQSMTFGDQSFTFRSLDEMLKLRALMEQQVNTTAGTSRSHRFAAVSKGVGGPNGDRFGGGWY
jgi:hypothetical protein